MDVLYVDDREDKELIDMGRIVLDCEIVVKRMNVGDYLYKDMLIERKTSKDLVSSVYDKRMSYQRYDMLETNYSSLYIFLVGWYDDIEGVEGYEWFSEKHWHGMIASCFERYQIPVVYTKDDIDFWNQLERFMHHHNDKKPIRRPVMADKCEDIQAQMLSMVPRLSVEKAEMILKEYEFLEIANLELEDLMEFKGIGKGLATNILESLNKGV